MSTGGAVAGFMAMMIARKREAIFRKFRELGAVTAASALPAAEIGVRADRLFRLQLRKGSVVESSPGRFHLDESAVARQATLRRRLLTALGALLLVALAILWLGG